MAPLGVFVCACQRLEVGQVYNGLINAAGNMKPVLEQPYRVLREATRDEWIAEMPARAALVSPWPIVAYYQVSTD